MANFKKLETLIKNFEAMSNDDSLAAIINCENVDVSTLTDAEKLSVLVFAEMAKALETREHYLVLDCNYPQSKMHNSEKYLVDYYRLVSRDTKNSSMIQFYVSASPKRGTCKFRLCTSCAKANREQFEALEDDLHFVVQMDKKSGRAKTSERKGINYEELVDVVKAVCAVLATQPETKVQPEEEPKPKATKKSKKAPKTQEPENEEAPNTENESDEEVAE